MPKDQVNQIHADEGTLLVDVGELEELYRLVGRASGMSPGVSHDIQNRLLAAAPVLEQRLFVRCGECGTKKAVEPGNWEGHDNAVRAIKS